MRRPLKDWTRHEGRFQTVMILPIQLAFNILGLAPLVLCTYLSLVRWSPTKIPNWWDAPSAGATNFILFLTDPLFLGAVGRTLLFVALSVGAEFFVGFLLAYLFIDDFFFKRNFITLIIIPMMMAPVINGYQWFLSLQPFGVINSILGSLIGRPVTLAWLSSPTLAPITIIITDIWQWTPFVFLVLLSGMMALPQDPIDVARVLGASRWQILRLIIVPMLKPLIILVLMLRAIEALKMFDTIWVTTQGGPGYMTQTLSMFIYEEGFRHMRVSYNAAISVAVWFIMLVITYQFIKRSRLIE